jgi:hypothetical protein
VWCHSLTLGVPSCVQLTNNYLGDLVSTYFIQQAFAGNSMVRVLQRVGGGGTGKMQALRGLTCLCADVSHDHG